ncbi:MAG TPA: hypothetical protein VMW50_13890 [Dehalococcoidia bacterium]|nr:hypothetical protein [Dehalococcoidia bacterium]
MAKKDGLSLSKDGMLTLLCASPIETKRYVKYRLPAELSDDEEPVVLFAGKHVYLHKVSDGGDVITKIVLNFTDKEA